MDQTPTFTADPTPDEPEEGRDFTDTETLTTNQTNFDQVSGREPCGNSNCPYSDDPAHSLEPVWIELVSPVPKPGQTLDNVLAPGVAQPRPEVFEQIKTALRPAGIDDFAISEVREAWEAVTGDYLADMPGRLMLKLAELSQMWEGEDFDAFAEQVEVTRTNLLEAIDEISTGTAELHQVEERIYADQGGGSGQIPFPAPDVWRAGDSMINDSQIHVRPVWASGECTKDRGEGDSWENLGMPEGTTASAIQLAEQRALYYQEQGLSESDARERALNDYDGFFAVVGEHFSTQMKRASDEHNSGIIDLRDSVTNAQGDPDLEHNARAPASIADTDMTMPVPDLEPPPTPEMPPLGGVDDYDMPPADPPDLPDPSADFGGTPSLPSTTGADFGGTPSPSTTGADFGGSNWSSADNPWGAATDDDELGGGLASGGGGLPSGGSGLPGGGLGGASGVGAGTGAGAAVMPGAGAGGAARGGGAAGAGKGTGRGGRSGMMGGGGGGRGAGTGENEDGRETWLTEDEDVWGITSEEDDPYA